MVIALALCTVSRFRSRSRVMLETADGTRPHDARGFDHFSPS